MATKDLCVSLYTIGRSVYLRPPRAWWGSFTSQSRYVYIKNTTSISHTELYASFLILYELLSADNSRKKEYYV